MLWDICCYCLLLLIYVFVCFEADAVGGCTSQGETADSRSRGGFKTLRGRMPSGLRRVGLAPSTDEAFKLGTCVGGGFKGGGFKKHVIASCVCVTTVLLAWLLKQIIVF